MKCAGGCGRTIVPAQANDCGAQDGPWYCDKCFERERERRSRVVKVLDSGPERRSTWRLFLDKLGLRSRGRQEAHHPIRGNPK